MCVARDNIASDRLSLTRQRDLANMSAMLTLMPRGVNFVLEALERRLCPPPIKPRHLAQRNKNAVGMTMSQKAAIGLVLTGYLLAPGPVSAAECRDETERLKRRSAHA
jgi:hypothetical protein